MFETSLSSKFRAVIDSIDEKFSGIRYSERVGFSKNRISGLSTKNAAISSGFSKAYNVATIAITITTAAIIFSDIE